MARRFRLRTRTRGITLEGMSTPISSESATSVSLTAYYKYSTFRFHVYESFDQDGPVQHYVKRTWPLFADGSFAWKSNVRKGIAPSQTLKITIAK